MAQAVTLTLTRTLALTLTLTLTQVKSFDDFWERHCANLGQVAFGSFITGAPYATISGAIVQLAIVQLVTVSGAVVSHSTVTHSKRSHGTVSLRRLPILRHPTPRHLVRVGRDDDLYVGHLPRVGPGRGHLHNHLHRQPRGGPRHHLAPSPYSYPYP